MFYAVANPTLAYVLLAIPVAVSGLLWLSVWLRRDSYRRRFQGWRRVWEMWLSTALLTAVLLGGWYWYTLWRPFYSMTVPAGGTWTLHHSLPRRDIQVESDEIQMVTSEREWLPIRRGTRRHYLRIELRDGRTFTSAPASADTINQLLSQLPR